MSATSGPAYTNIHHVGDPRLRTVLEATWNQPTFPHLLHQIRVERAEIFRSLVLSHGRVLHREPNARQVAGRLAHFDAAPCREIDVSGPAAYGGYAVGRANFGHLLIDNFQSIAVMLDFGFDGSFILDTPAPMLLPVLREGLDLLKIPEERRIFIRSYERSFVGDISVPAGHTYSARHRDATSLRSLSSRLVAGLPDTPQGKHALYVKRGAGFENRAVENVEALFEAISPHVGEVRTFDPLAHSLSEQLAAFRSARAVIGIMGAALCSKIACHVGTPVVYLVPPNMPGLFYWSLSRGLDLPYFEIRARAPGDSRDQRFKLDPADIVECADALAKFLGTRPKAAGH